MYPSVWHITAGINAATFKRLSRDFSDVLVPLMLLITNTLVQRDGMVTETRCYFA